MYLQVECLRQRQQDLEVQIRRVKEERDALTTELESLHERLLLLEKQRQHQDDQVCTRVYVYMRVCVFARARARACVCLCANVLKRKRQSLRARACARACVCVCVHLSVRHRLCAFGQLKCFTLFNVSIHFLTFLPEVVYRRGRNFDPLL